jgi:hypothetical protein
MAYKGSPNGGNDSNDLVLHFAGNIHFSDKGGGNDGGDGSDLYNDDAEEDITGSNKKMPANVVRTNCEDDNNNSSLNNDKKLPALGAGSSKDPVNLVNSTDEGADEYLNKKDSDKETRNMLPAIEGSSNSDSNSVRSHPPFKVSPVAKMPSPQSTTCGLWSHIGCPMLYCHTFISFFLLLLHLPCRGNVTIFESATSWKFWSTS